MPVSAGKLRETFDVQSPTGTDTWGAPSGEWVTLGQLRGGPKTDSGMGAIRNGQANGVPLAVTRYSVEIHGSAQRHFAIDETFRLVNKRDGAIFSVRGVVVDYEDPQRVYVLCEVGGNAG